MGMGIENLRICPCLLRIEDRYFLGGACGTCALGQPVNPSSDLGRGLVLLLHRVAVLIFFGCPECGLFLDC